MRRDILATILLLSVIVLNAKNAEATEAGIPGQEAENAISFENLAYGKPVFASSSYSDNFKPKYAVDNSNATIWRPKTSGNESLTIDLEDEMDVEQVLILFEHFSSYHQYLIEYSKDGISWKVFSDKRDNRLAGNPMADYGNIRTRYIRLTVTGNEKNGQFGGVRSIKVLSGINTDSIQQLVAVSSADLACRTADKKTILSNRYGMSGGKWRIKGKLSASQAAGIACLNLEPGCVATLPSSGNAHTPTFTLAYRIFGTASQALHPIVLWDMEQETVDLSIETRDMPSWHQVVWVANGHEVRHYVDGTLTSTKPVNPAKSPLFLTIQSGKRQVQLTDLTLFNRALPMNETAKFFKNPISAPEPATARNRNQALFSINADDYAVRTTQYEIGEFKANGNPVDVVMKQGRKAFAFDGTQQFLMHKALPVTMEENAPYSIEAWVMNPQADIEETILDLIQNGNEHGNIIFGSGFDPEDGVMNHANKDNNTGIREAVAKILFDDAPWQHWVITFDGYTERFYLNGKLWREINMSLNLPHCEEVSIGSRRDGSYPFNGYLHSLDAYDYVVSDTHIMNNFRSVVKADRLIDFHAADITGTTWNNEGRWGGTTILTKQPSAHAGRKGLTSDITLNTKVHSPSAKSYLTTFCLLQETGTNVLDLNGTSLTLPSMRPGQWHEAVLQQEGVWKFYIDGQLKTALEEITTESNTLHISLLSQDNDAPVALISDIVLSNTVLSEQELKDNYHHLYETPFEGHNITVEAVPLTPRMARLTVKDSNQTLRQDRWRYSYNGGEWVKSTEQLVTIPKDGRAMHVEIQDAYGNVLSTLPDIPVSVFESDFRHIQDVYTIDKWDELVLGAKAEPYYEAGFSPHTIMLGSTNANFTRIPDENGPLLCHHVNGDFVLQVKVPFLFGQERLTTPANNEGGLMVLHPNNDATQDILQLGISPLNECGNVLTEVTKDGRSQFPNKLGWKYHPYLQIERRGDAFHFRTSSDGYNWIEMPGSPVERPEWHGQSIKAGIFQTTYTDNHATVTFEEYNLWQRK